MFREAADANSNPRLQPKTHSFELLLQQGVEGQTPGADPLVWNELLPTPWCSLCFAGAQDLAQCVQNLPLINSACNPSLQGEMEADAKLPPGANFFFLLTIELQLAGDSGSFSFLLAGYGSTGSAAALVPNLGPAQLPAWSISFKLQHPPAAGATLAFHVIIEHE